MTKGTKPQEYYRDEAGIHPVFPLSAVVAPGDVVAEIGNDEIKDTHIDWGTGAGQVSAADLPIADAGSCYTGAEVETALQEIAGAGRTTETVKANADAIATKVPTSRQIIAGTGLSGGGDLTADRTLTLVYGWYKIADPATGWFASKTSGWTADRFAAADGGWEVDFSSVVPAGTRAVWLYSQIDASGGHVATRKYGDTNISNTPFASLEYSHWMQQVPTVLGGNQVLIWLSADYKAEFAVSAATIDLFLSYPSEYLI